MRQSVILITKNVQQEMRECKYKTTKHVVCYYLSFLTCVMCTDIHLKSGHIQSFSGHYLVRMQEDTNQKNCEYRHFSRSEKLK